MRLTTTLLLVTGGCAGAFAQPESSAGIGNVECIRPIGSEEPLEWSVTLRDGSRLEGAPSMDRLRLLGAVVAQAEIAPEGIVSLHLDRNAETVTVHGQNGERVTGAVRNELLELETGLGSFEIPFGRIRSIQSGDHDCPTHGAAGHRPLGAPHSIFQADDSLVDFETDPSGKRLTVGQDLSETFVPFGLKIATSIETSFPAVDSFTVQSKSRGFSCATQSPRWNGTLTLTFCEPGRPERPASVSRVGLWIASVSPNSTRLRALDAAGNVVAEALTTQSGTDFLAVESEADIASVEIIPDPNIDRDYTIDDVVFDVPRRASGEGTYTVTCTTGDVLEARGFVLDGDQVVLSGLSFREQALRVERDRVVSIRFPR